MKWDSALSLAVGIFSIVLAIYTLIKAEAAETRMNNIFNQIQNSLAHLRQESEKIDQGVNITQQQHINLIGQISKEQSKIINKLLPKKPKGNNDHEK